MKLTFPITSLTYRSVRRALHAATTDWRSPIMRCLSDSLRKGAIPAPRAPHGPKPSVLDTTPRAQATDASSPLSIAPTALRLSTQSSSRLGKPIGSSAHTPWQRHLHSIKPSTTLTVHVRNYSNILFTIVLITLSLWDWTHSPASGGEQLAILPAFLPGLLAAATKTAIPAWLGGIGSAIAGGVGSGLSRRAETFLAGDRAKGDYAGTGGAAGAQAQSIYATGTQQAASQGQSQAFSGAQNARFQSSQQAFSATESAKQRAHEMNMLQTEMSSNAQAGVGQSPFHAGAESMASQSPFIQEIKASAYKRKTARQSPRLDIGLTQQGRHYGSTW